jgi:1,4-dihydroxy-2-naphthoyl-CoA hydrolase
VTDLLARAQATLPPMMKMLGVEIVSVELDRVVAQMTAREEMSNGTGILHGGAYMTFADFMGALGTVVNLQKGTSTTTIESKTNFFAPAKVGSIVRGECLPLHRGRRTMVWQTRLTNADGRLLALVTQTQMVLEMPRKEG